VRRKVLCTNKKHNQGRKGRIPQCNSIYIDSIQNGDIKVVMGNTIDSKPDQNLTERKLK